MKNKKMLKLRLHMSHDYILINIDVVRCVYAIDGITSVFVGGQDEPLQCRDSVDEISSDIYALYE